MKSDLDAAVVDHVANWVGLHQEFGLGFIFSSNLHRVKAISLNVKRAIVPFEFCESHKFEPYEFLEYVRNGDGARSLQWIELPSDHGRSRLWLKALNENRQILIASKQLFVIHIPCVIIDDIDWRCPDLWSVRSWQFVLP